VMLLAAQKGLLLDTHHHRQGTEPSNQTENKTLSPLAPLAVQAT